MAWRFQNLCCRLRRKEEFNRFFFMGLVRLRNCCYRWIIMHRGALRIYDMKKKSNNFTNCWKSILMEIINRQLRALAPHTSSRVNAAVTTADYCRMTVTTCYAEQIPLYQQKWGLCASDSQSYVHINQIKNYKTKHHLALKTDTFMAEVMDNEQ